MAVYAVFDVLDRMGCQYEQALVGDFKAEAKVLGHTSEYALSLIHISCLRRWENESGTCLLWLFRGKRTGDAMSPMLIE